MALSYCMFGWQLLFEIRFYQDFCSPMIQSYEVNCQLVHTDCINDSQVQRADFAINRPNSTAADLSPGRPIPSWDGCP